MTAFRCSAICQFISRSSTKNLKPTPRVALRLGGYNDMTQQMLPVFSEFKNPRTLEKDNPVLEATTILMKNYRPLENFRFKMKNAGLKSGQGKSILPQNSEAFKIRFRIPVQEEFISCKVKGCRRGPVAMMRGSNMGYPALLAYHIIDHMGASCSLSEVMTTL